VLLFIYTLDIVLVHAICLELPSETGPNSIMVGGCSFTTKLLYRSLH